MNNFLNNNLQNFESIFISNYLIEILIDKGSRLLYRKYLKTKLPSFISESVLQ